MDLRYDNDLVIQKGDLVLVDTLNEDAQHIKDRLLTFRGEWFLDLLFGPDYRTYFLIKNPNLPVVGALLRKEILASVPGAKILEFNVSQDTQRQMNITYKVTTGNGTVSSGVTV